MSSHQTSTQEHKLDQLTTVNKNVLQGVE